MVLFKKINKKGDVTDIIILVITIFLVGVMFLVYGYFIPAVATALNGTNIATNETNPAINQLNTIGTTGMDQGFLILFAGLIIVEIFSAFLIRQHPIFLFLYFVTMLVGTLLSIYLQNAFESIQAIPLFATTISNMPILSYVMAHLVISIVVIDILTLLVIFAKVGSPKV